VQNVLALLSVADQGHGGGFDKLGGFVVQQLLRLLLFQCFDIVIRNIFSTSSS
jgi:hypothetical protein